MAEIPRDDPPAYSPPTGPPPSNLQYQTAEPPPYPPPPGLGHASSSGANATGDEAEQADIWCRFYPLTPPFPLASSQLRAVHAQEHSLLTPPNFKGSATLVNAGNSTWRVASQPGCKDSFIQTALPIFSEPSDSPMYTERSKTIYYEIRILSLGARQDRLRLGSMFSRHAANEECGVALGFFAPPYPPFRLPGWQRGSLAVHSDDGRRYVGNNEGGVDFTTPFQAGETIGLGMTFDVTSTHEGPAMDVEVFFTRDGKKAGGWNLVEDTDSEWESVTGLQGEHDIFAGIGVFGPVEIEVNFGEQSWFYRGWNSST